jgi:hypothetical protein
MMAKYLLLEFDRDEDAEAFASTLEADNTTIHAVGMYKKPTLFCDCTDSGEKSVFGSKWGWFVHKVCGRPRRSVWQGPKNLLKPNEDHGKRPVIVSIREPRNS